MKTLHAIMKREDFILPSMLPLDYTHRASYHEYDGSMTWRWFGDEAKARQWLKDMVCPRIPSGFEVGPIAWDADGNPATAEVRQGSRRFTWSKRLGYVQQFIEHPVCNEQGHGDGYWKKARPQIASTVMQAIRAYLAQRNYQEPTP